MNCDEVSRFIHAYSDGELDLPRSLEVEEHLRTCAACEASYENLRALKRSTSAAYFPVPDGLRENVLTAVRRTRPIDIFNARRDFRPWLLTGLAIAAAVLLGFFLGRSFVHRAPEQALLAEITDSHIRSLVGTHLTDVISSDQHTVRPWFEGKLDFAPPVEDLSGSGFPLIGGRVEYIDGRPAAALVYERRKHFINLFIWPASDGAAPITATKPRRGYSILHWQRAGMNYWAVSEISEDDLRKFAAAFSDAVAPSR